MKMNMSSESNKQFSLLSYEITKSLDSKIIKDNGIYFTPNDVILLCLNKIKKYESEYKIIINEILETCCGSCEFVLLLDDYFKNKNIDAIENNSDIFKKIK